MAAHHSKVETRTLEEELDIKVEAVTGDLKNLVPQPHNRQPYMSTEEMLILTHKCLFFSPRDASDREAWLEEVGLTVDVTEENTIRHLVMTRKDLWCQCAGECQLDTCPCKQAGIRCHPNPRGCSCNEQCEGCRHVSRRARKQHYADTKRRLLKEEQASSEGRKQQEEQAAAGGTAVGVGTASIEQRLNAALKSRSSGHSKVKEERSVA